MLHRFKLCKKLSVVGSMEALLKAFLLFFLLSDWLKLNHLKSRMECGFSDIFSRHICSTIAETIGMTNYAAIFNAKNVQKTTFEAAEIMLGPWNQQSVLGKSEKSDCDHVRQFPSTMKIKDTFRKENLSNRKIKRYRRKTIVYH